MTLPFYVALFLAVCFAAAVDTGQNIKQEVMLIQLGPAVGQQGCLAHAHVVRDIMDSGGDHRSVRAAPVKILRLGAAANKALFLVEIAP